MTSWRMMSIVENFTAAQLIKCMFRNMPYVHSMSCFDVTCGKTNTTTSTCASYVYLFWSLFCTGMCSTPPTGRLSNPPVCLPISGWICCMRPQKARGVQGKPTPHIQHQQVASYGFTSTRRTDELVSFRRGAFAPVLPRPLWPGFPGQRRGRGGMQVVC